MLGDLWKLDLLWGIQLSGGDDNACSGMADAEHFAVFPAAEYWLFPKPLTEEEERHYLALVKAGDVDARNVLIERNLRLVAHIMKKY